MKRVQYWRWCVRCVYDEARDRWHDTRHVMTEIELCRTTERNED
jgi:hypothetical protein